MPKNSNEWAENVSVVHENVLLVFNKEDAEVARQWSRPKNSGKDEAEIPFSRLREEHANLVSIAGRLSSVIARDEPPPSTDLYALRQELIGAVIRHLKREDWVVYPRLLASSDNRVEQTARSFSKEMGGLAKTFTDYAQRWGSFAIEDDWPGYRRETAKIISALTQRITRENRDLYPLLEAH